MGLFSNRNADRQAERERREGKAREYGEKARKARKEADKYRRMLANGESDPAALRAALKDAEVDARIWEQNARDYRR
ncbi:hypothetical protein ABZ801_15970 [Actinomadura sp. NPDC047616]|uniref:hypothetical protein n=1 Tax=Actinomadura sp. NPDC047616 TaxID=3155914 RepID=UPI0033DA77C9